MEKQKSSSLTDKVWDVFASVKTAVVIFVAIALTSMVGTVLEQGEEPAKNLQILAKFFGESGAQPAYTFFNKLGFMDMYHSWWFVGFQLLFAANLIICSLDRLPRIWKLVKEPIRPLSRDHIEKMSIKRSLSIKGGVAKEAVESALKAIGFAPSQSAEQNQTQFYAEKGNYTRLGVYITHLSILIILLGAILGVYLGFNASLALPEGETSSFAYKGPEKKFPLGFDIRCDNFEVEYYPEHDMPKAYKSLLTVFKNGTEVMKKVITVNDPLTYEGITFYQSSFGMIPGAMEKGIVMLRVVTKDGRTGEVSGRVGDSFNVPGTQVRGRITNFSPAISMDQSGRPYTFDQNMINPAVYLDVDTGGTHESRWVLKRFPQTWMFQDGTRIELLDYWGVQYTGLQVRKDPGVWVVYLGCIIMAVGLYITFFMSHRRIWVLVTEEKGGSSVLVGASAHRNRAAFETRIEKMVGALNRPKGDA